MFQTRAYELITYSVWKHTYIISNVCKQAGFRVKSDRMWQFDILFITTMSSNAADLISSGKQGRKFKQW